MRSGDLRPKFLMKTLVALTVSASGVLHAENIRIPNTFSPGVGAKAGEVNANFSTVVGGINSNILSITENKERIDTNQAGIATNKEGIADNKVGVAKNIVRIDANQSSVAINKEGVAINKEGVATNQEDIATNAKNISSYEARIAELEQKVADLVADMQGTSISMVGDYYLKTIEAGVESEIAWVDPDTGRTGWHHWHRLGSSEGIISFFEDGTCSVLITEDDVVIYGGDEGQKVFGTPSTNSCTYMLSASGLLTLFVPDGSVEIDMSPNLQMGVYSESDRLPNDRTYELGTLVKKTEITSEATE